MGDRSRRRIWRTRMREPLARHKRLVLATALAGLCVGAAVPLLRPPEAVATTALILNHRAGEDPADAMTTDANLATSRELAVQVVDRLRLQETPDELLTQYTATPRTDRVLQISARAESGTEAKRIVRTIAQLFLVFRVEQSDTRMAPLQSALADARAEVTGLERTAVPTLTTGGSNEDVTKARITAAQERVQQMKDEIAKEEASSAPIARSVVLDPATVRTPSRFVQAGRDGAIGFCLGLAGMAGLVVMSGLLAYRPRREAVDALDAPAAWETDTASPPPPSPSPPLSPYEPVVAVEVDAAPPEETYELDAAVETVRRELAHGDLIRPTLALVPIGCVGAAASLAAAVARRCAEDGVHVLLADLSEHGDLARTLGTADAGTSAVYTDGAEGEISLHRPTADEPKGRLGADGPEGADDELLIAWVLSDLVLTLVEPAPSPALEHLHTWAASADMVAAGHRPSPATLTSLEERVRATGVSLESVVVLDAAETPESSAVTADVASPADDLVAHSVEAGR